MLKAAALFCNTNVYLLRIDLPFRLFSGVDKSVHFTYRNKFDEQSSTYLPMRNRFAFATAVVFAVAIMITIPFKGFILPSTAVAQQQQLNSNTSSSQSTNSSSANPLPLKTIFKQVENSVVQITRYRQQHLTL
jgi:hypothetical protein